MKKNYIKIALLLFSTTLIAQESKITNHYINYFQNTREVPFLHLNKTSFLKGEEIWLKAYIQEQNSQKLHPTTTNLYVSIFEKSGKLKDQHLIHVKKGVGSGNIFIDSTYTENTYYLKASTKWMKNFKEDNAYLQKINIISAKPKEKKLYKENSYEFKLFPEGGNLIANTTNTLGILIKDSNGKGVKIKKGIIKDENNQIIRYFNTNNNGMNKVSLFIKNNTTYTFSTILFNGLEIKSKTKKPTNYGVTMNTSYSNEKVGINIITNEASLKKLKGKHFKILVHNTRSYKTYSFSFNENKKKYTLIIDKKDLLSGINMITLFNDKNLPVSERLLFNHSNLFFNQLTIKTKESSNDSIKVSFLNNSNEKVFLSTSFLPLSSKAYNPKNNIASSFLLSPYIKGNIQNAGNYFKDLKNKEQRRNLDLLLLTQGWSKYKWTNIFNDSQKINFQFENGIDVTTRFNNPIKKNQSILLFSEDNNLITTFKPNQKTWVLKNSFLKKNSSLKFALKNRQGKLLKITPSLSYSGGKLSDFLDVRQETSSLNKEVQAVNFKAIKNNFETLNEVEIKINKKKTAHKDYPETGMYRHLGEKDFIKGVRFNIFDFIRAKLPIRKKVTKFYLDGKNIIREPYLANGLYMDQIKDVFFGNDIGRTGYVFYVFTLSPKEYADRKNSNSNVTLKLGFNLEKEFYTPKYPSFTNETYQNYGAIYWNPNVIVNPNSTLTQETTKNSQNNIIIHIEGISESGKLISKKYLHFHNPI